MVKTSHDFVVGMFGRSMVCLVKDEERDVAAHLDVAVAEGVEQDLRGGYHDAVLGEHAGPQLGILPLVRLGRAGDEADGDGDGAGDDVALLLDESDCWGDEPRDLGAHR